MTRVKAFFSNLPRKNIRANRIDEPQAKTDFARPISNTASPNPTLEEDVRPPV